MFSKIRTTITYKANTEVKRERFEIYSTNLIYLHLRTVNLKYT